MNELNNSISEGSMTHFVLKMRKMLFNFDKQNAFNFLLDNVSEDNVFSRLVSVCIHKLVVKRVIRESHSHRPQSIPWYREEKTHDNNSHTTAIRQQNHN